jgi:hypothetical protein
MDSSASQPRFDGLWRQTPCLLLLIGVLLCTTKAGVDEFSMNFDQVSHKPPYVKAEWLVPQDRNLPADGP